MSKVVLVIAPNGAFATMKVQLAVVKSNRFFVCLFCSCSGNGMGRCRGRQRGMDANAHQF